MPNCANCMSFISLQLVFPKVALILKTFTFVPYCYPYASPSAAFLTGFSTPNLRLACHSNTLPSKFHIAELRSSAICELLEQPPRGGARYSNRKISTGRILDAERAGRTVAAML